MLGDRDAAERLAIGANAELCKSGGAAAAKDVNRTGGLARDTSGQESGVASGHEEREPAAGSSFDAMNASGGKATWHANAEGVGVDVGWSERGACKRCVLLHGGMEAVGGGEGGVLCNTRFSGRSAAPGDANELREALALARALCEHKIEHPLLRKLW
jgi:hypothetical protein